MVREILEKRNGELPRAISDQKFNDYIKKVCEAVGFTEVVKGTKKMPTGEYETILVHPKDAEPFKRTSAITRNVEGLYPRFELVTSHVCRKSFATNNYGKLPNLTIMAITGHKSEKVFISYVKTSRKEHAEKLLEILEGDKSQTLETLRARVIELEAENKALIKLLSEKVTEVKTEISKLKKNLDGKLNIQ